MDGADSALATAWRAIGGGAELPARVRWSGPVAALASPLPVPVLARAVVGAYALAGLELAAARGIRPPAGPVVIDGGALGTAFTSERHLRLDGTPFPTFVPLSRFWRTADGWVRTHANYPHHRARLLAALGGSDDPDAVAARLAELTAVEVEDRVTAAGGLAVAVRTPADWAAHPQGRRLAGVPLVTRHAEGTATASSRVVGRHPLGTVLPASGVRVLDLTRVIAGPVATRSLALLGADVLRVDDPRLPELPGQHLDTGPGKRSTLLDLSRAVDRATFDDLLAGADVVVTGYRPGALDRYGLAAPALLDRHPDLVVAELSAWGPVGPWAGRRGFDSLVQAATGIAVLVGSADEPGALPAQALDHGTGYLLAAAVLRGLAERAAGGGGRSVRLSLARTAWWLTEELPAPRTVAEPSDADAGRWCVTVEAPSGRLRHALPPVRLPGGPGTWAHAAHPWGTDQAAWF